MQQIKKLALLTTLLALAACEDENVKQCAELQNDTQKQSLARSFCEKAAQKGDPIGQFFLAKEELAQGKRKEAVELLTKSANQKNAEATFLLAELYMEDKEVSTARFYYQYSCDLNFIKGCERISVLNSQNESEQQKFQKEADAAKEAQAKAEQQAKEAERQAKAAEQKALEAEKLRLEQERKQLEEKKHSVNIESLFMTKEEAIDAYKSFISTVNQNKSLEDWINNCYARSNNKRGCFHFDMWVSLLDEQFSKHNNKTPDPFFADSRVRNRALRNIPELQNVTTAQFNRLVEDARKTLNFYDSSFFEMFESSNRQNAQSIPSNNTKIDVQGLDFQENLAKFQQNGLWGFVDRQGNIVISPQFSGAGGFYNGRAVVQVSNQNWGYIDKKGNWIVSPQYCMAGRFSEGLAGVYVNGYRSGDNCYGGKWGFIDVNGNFVINAVFDEATRFNKGKAKVTYKGQSGYINRNAQWVD